MSTTSIPCRRADIRLCAHLLRAGVPATVAEDITMATLTGWSDEEYLRATDLASDALNPPAIPAWVEMTAPADGWQRQAVLGCRGDERWRVLYALAGSLLRHGYPVALVAVLAQAWGNARCRPVPTWDDVARVVARVGEAAA